MSDTDTKDPSETVESVVVHPPVTETNQRPIGNTALRELIEKNIKWSQVIYNQNRKIQRRLTWITIGNYLRLFVIIAPIILGIIFLPSMFEQFMEQYGGSFELLRNNQGALEMMNNAGRQ